MVNSIECVTLTSVRIVKKITGGWQIWGGAGGGGRFGEGVSPSSSNSPSGRPISVEAFMHDLKLLFVYNECK